MISVLGLLLLLHPLPSFLLLCLLLLLNLLHQFRNQWIRKNFVQRKGGACLKRRRAR